MPRSVQIILDNVRSHHNVGSVFRSCDAFGVALLHLCGITPCPPHRDIHKSALGATESVPWKYAESTDGAIAEAKSAGYRVVAIEQSEYSIWLPSSQKIEDEKIALVLGNEVKGVQDEILAQCDAVWEIEQVGTKKSLNISVCAGICIHHLTSIT